MASFLDRKDRGHRSPVTPPFQPQQGRTYNQFPGQSPYHGQFQAAKQYQGRGRGRGATQRGKKHKFTGNYNTVCFYPAKFGVFTYLLLSNCRPQPRPQEDTGQRNQSQPAGDKPVTPLPRLPQVRLSQLDINKLAKIQLDLDSQTPFAAGAIKNHYHQWASMTSDPHILGTIRGFTFDFLCQPIQDHWPKQIVTDPDEVTVMLELLRDLEIKRVIEPISAPHPYGFLSNVFLRPKRSGGHRMILNLKELNTFVEYVHFKMDHLNTTLPLISPGCYFTSLDLADAYYSVPVARHHRKFMQFSFNGQFYQFTCLANGVSSAPRTFTKIMKVPLSTLRLTHGIIITAYLDDLLIIADSPAAVLQATDLAQEMLRSLGFTISVKKSVVRPCTSITFLGFDIDSVSMRVTIPAEKASEIQDSVQLTIQNPHMSVRQFAGVVGKLAATLPANRHGQLYLKHLEMAKARALQGSPLNYDVLMNITPCVLLELKWWHDNITLVHRPVNQSNPDLTIFTDASLLGWGCYIPVSQSKFGGRWGPEDLGYDINYLELKAILLSLQTCAKDHSAKHIQVRSDNTTAVVSINRQGSTHSSRCNNITRLIWRFAIDEQLWLSSAHCPGVLNVQADEASRNFNDNTEWTLRPQLFQNICDTFGTPSIDLFASRLNNQVPQYCAWQPDPGATVIDCFSVDWSNYELTYSFPPFSLVGRTLRKILQECQEAILVVPHWPSQPWFPLLTKYLHGQPLILPVNKRTLTLPHEPTRVHSLAGQLQLWACLVCNTT